MALPRPRPWRIFRYGGALLVFLVCSLVPQLLWAGKITVLVPPLKTTVLARRPGTHLIVQLDDQADLARLRVIKTKGEKTIEPVGSWSRHGKFFVHYRLPLAPGKNEFLLTPGDQSIRIKYRPLRSLLGVNFDSPALYVFHRKGTDPPVCAGCHTKKLPPGVEVVPSPYGSFSAECYSCHLQIIQGSAWKHSPAANVLCRSCHQAKAGQDKITIPTGKVNTLCYRCHVNEKKWMKMPHVHGPVGIGDCTVCHDPHGDRYNGQLWADGKSDLCLACHVDKKQIFGKGPNMHVHGIVSGGGCIACHSPHASNYRFQLYKPINELCTGCHTSLKGVTRGHPISNHPVEGKKDPRRPNRMMSCTSCHNPHGSPYSHLLIGELVGGYFCTKCHKN